MNRYYKGRFKHFEDLEIFRRTIVKTLEETSGNSLTDFDISLIHTKVSVEKINEFRLKAFKYLNQIDYCSILHRNLFNHISQLLGPELLIQKKINLSIQLPNDSSSILPAHSDCSSGDSPFELVLWIPLTNAYESNSMFIQSKEISINYYESLKKNEFIDIKAKEEDFLKIDYGSYILFCPALIHGNILNKTVSSRVSMNIRFKSVYAPYTPTIVNDRLYGSYFQLWNSTELFDLGSTVFNLLK